ncbi:MAG: hypothetical protein ACUZ8O_08870 [Candidatus Anammoxibacter sp.]
MYLSCRIYVVILLTHLIVLSFMAYSRQACLSDPLPVGSIVFGDMSGVIMEGKECDSLDVNPGEGKPLFTDWCERFWPVNFVEGCPSILTSNTTVEFSLTSSNRKELSLDSSLPLVQTYLVTAIIEGQQMFGCATGRIGSVNVVESTPVRSFTLTYMGNFNIEYRRINEQQVSIVRGIPDFNDLIPEAPTTAIALISTQPAVFNAPEFIPLLVDGSCTPGEGGCELRVRIGWEFLTLAATGLQSFGLDFVAVCGEGNKSTSSTLICANVSVKGGGIVLGSPKNAEFDISVDSEVLDFTPDTGDSATPSPTPTPTPQGGCRLVCDPKNVIFINKDSSASVVVRAFDEDGNEIHVDLIVAKDSGINVSGVVEDNLGLVTPQEFKITCNDSGETGVIFIDELDECEDCRVSFVCKAGGGGLGCSCTDFPQTQTKPMSKLMNKLRDRIETNWTVEHDYIELYNDNMKELTQIVNSHPALASKLRSERTRFMPSILLLIFGEPVVLSTTDVERIEAILDAIYVYASPQLEYAIDQIRSDLHSEEIMSSFGISIE